MKPQRKINVLAILGVLTILATVACTAVDSDKYSDSVRAKWGEKQSDPLPATANIRDTAAQIDLQQLDALCGRPASKPAPGQPAIVYKRNAKGQCEALLVTTGKQ